MAPAFKDNPTSHPRITWRAGDVLLSRAMKSFFIAVFGVLAYSTSCAFQWASAEKSLWQNFHSATTNNSLVWLMEKELYFHRSGGRANTGAMPFLSGTPAFFALSSFGQFRGSKLSPCTEWAERRSRGCAYADKMQCGGILVPGLAWNCVWAQTHTQTNDHGLIDAKGRGAWTIQRVRSLRVLCVTNWWFLSNNVVNSCL